MLSERETHLKRIKDLNRSICHNVINQSQKLKPKAVNIELPETIETAEPSQHSQDILSHFGLAAPLLLNINSCHV